MSEPVAKSPLMQSFIVAAKEAAKARAAVLVTGESGAGKTYWAQWLHQQSGAPGQPQVFSGMWCDPAAIAHALNQTGTVILDEVAGLPQAVQRALIELLDRSPKAWVVSLTRDEPVSSVAAGRLMPALLHRIDVFRLGLPPLRARLEDLVPLATELLDEHAKATGKRLAFGRPGLEALSRHDWPGNVRELGNTVVRAASRTLNGWIEPADLALTRPDPTRPLLPPEVPIDLDALERLAIAEALRRVNGNRTHAAKLLGIGLRTLRAKLNSRDVDAGAGLEPELKKSA
ncbi:MAG: sigma 54-interacting transcriptional regulator [Myxococcaceae bacterium]